MQPRRDPAQQAMDVFLPPLPGLRAFVGSGTHGLRRGLHSFAASRLGLGFQHWRFRRELRSSAAWRLGYVMKCILSQLLG